MKIGQTLIVDELVRDEERVRQMSPEDFDSLPYGAIKLDSEGRVLVYNAAEAELARLDAVEQIGKSFFDEIAPCTNNAMFRGRLESLADEGRTNARFDYRFQFPWGERDVRVQFWLPGDGSRWIFVTSAGSESLA